MKKVQYLIIDSEFVNGTNNNFSVTFGITSNTFIEDMREVIGIKVVDFYITQIGGSDDGTGNTAKFVESVSLNCLELACLGIPTLLTKEGLGTWPDLARFKIFLETDWLDFGTVADQVLRVSQRHFTKEEIAEITSIIDIKNQVEKLLL